MPADEQKRTIPRWLTWWAIPLLVVPASVWAERLPIKTYTTADGLPSNFIHRLVRDSRGFLWFCTADGLSRYDGYSFTTYGMEQGLSHQDIRDILETRSGRYWIATHGGGVYRFNLQSEIRYPQSKGPQFTAYLLGDPSVHVLYEDRAGQLWAGTDGGLFILEETNGLGTFRRVELGVSREVVRALVEDQEGSLWIGIEGGLVRRLPNGRMIRYMVQPSPSLGDPVWALLLDREGRLWVGHQYAGLIVLNPNRLRIADFESEQGAGGKEHRAPCAKRHALTIRNPKSAI